MPDQLVKKKSEYEVVGDLSSLRDKSPVQNAAKDLEVVPPPIPKRKKCCCALL
uniref:Uncharacterized protein n=2 Tax=Meloidogyne TaxID=189290 RepID=A0A914NE17_MELIC|nr:unnamed protein product [Meloidogyne enterolobii]